MAKSLDCVESTKDLLPLTRYPHRDGPDVRDRLHQFYTDIVSSLNLSELRLLLVQEKVLTSQEAHCSVTSPELLLQKVKDIGLLGYQKLYVCITQEKKHLGHRYVQALLENKVYACDRDFEASSAIKDRIVSHLTVLETCDLMRLLTYMYEKELLTPQEWQKLKNEVYYTNELLVHIIVILDTKGPLAYIRFANCLFSLDNDVHTQLFTNESNTKDTYTRTGQKKIAVLPTKEALHKQKLHGCLKGARYDKIMTVFQECHHNGKWDTLEAEVDKLMTPETPKELRIVANLESAVSWIFRKKEDKVLHFVFEAKVLSAQVDGDNAIILEGRCEYILSRLYRYLRQFDKAEQHVQKAIYLLHMVAPGEDTAFVHYCNGSIQVERLSNNSTERECRHAQLSYEHAIDHARIHDSGLDLVAPHSFMRLAQM